MPGGRPLGQSPFDPVIGRDIRPRALGSGPLENLAWEHPQLSCSLRLLNGQGCQEAQYIPVSILSTGILLMAGGT